MSVQGSRGHAAMKLLVTKSVDSWFCSLQHWLLMPPIWSCDNKTVKRYHISHPGKTKKMTNVCRVVFYSTVLQRREMVIILHPRVSLLMESQFFYFKKAVSWWYVSIRKFLSLLELFYCCVTLLCFIQISLYHHTLLLTFIGIFTSS